ncbi:Fur family transcriptional regulator, ferric uptake regulator [Algoriphagus locisalis]|uniref:Fur family transcriptional regulator, ferric uptake regulator n=1 Tax=Algoriphagus locisalis TaxID=305507 RepID=A0A1I6XFA4_9BACT|nr:transcriptional repressor [Algoriphagus locisalis]SFT36712.1 Fur family transcriptional regulator, ferric uptake regulator [Algoriphagus locisalis]
MGKTIARATILRIIQHASHPVSYSEIKQQLENTCSRVTLYRMLLRLEKEKSIYRFPDFNGDFRYSLCTEKDHSSTHNHFQCLACDKVYSLEAEHIETSIPEEYLVQTVHIMTAGICPHCQIFKEN